MSQQQYQHQPLEGVKVIDLTTYGAGPSVGRVLGDWGASVIKVETSTGDPSRVIDGNLGWPKINGTSWSWENLNGNKRSLSVDLQKPEGIAVMHRMLAEADVFLSSFRVKALKKLGLDYETMSKQYPRMIWAHVSGYGEEGPLSGDPGFDTVCYWARGGGMIDFAEKDTAPLTTPMGHADYQSGVSTAGGIAAALYRQAKTGLGEKVTFSLLGQAIWNSSSMFLATQAGKKQYPTSRKENAALANTYRCKDGEWVVVTCFEWDRYFPKVCDVLNMTELLSDPRFATTDNAFQHRAELIDIMEQKIGGFTSEEFLAAMKAQDIPCSRLRHIKDIVDDEQAHANHFIYKLKGRFPEMGEWYDTSAPIQFGGAYPPKHSPAPLLGEHTDEILGELGYSEEEIQKLRKDDVVF